jgi:hypothetical protein
MTSLTSTDTERKAMNPTNRTTLTAVLLLIILSLGNHVAAQGHSQDADTAVIASFIAGQARRQHGEEYEEARKILAGDLDGDGAPETVVLYTIEGQGGSNNYVQYLAVFTRAAGRWRVLAHAPVGGKSGRSVELHSVDNQVITLTTLSYAPKDASCCPSVKGTTTYVLDGRRLSERRMVPRPKRPR